MPASRIEAARTRDRPHAAFNLTKGPPLRDVEMRLPPVEGDSKVERKLHVQQALEAGVSKCECLMASLSCATAQHLRHPIDAAPTTYRLCITHVIPQFLLNEVFSFLPVYPELLKLCLTSRNFARASNITTSFKPQCGKCEECLNNFELHCLQPRYQLPAAAVPKLLKHSYTTLQVLVLAGITDLEDAHLARALPMMQQLQVLDLSTCRNLTDETALLVGRHLRCLACLSFRDVNKLTDRGLSAVATSCRRLEALVLLGCDRVTDCSIKTFAASAPALRALNVWGCHNLSDDSLLALAEHHVSLLELNVRYCHRLSGKALQAVARRSDQLLHLNARYILQLNDVSTTELLKCCPNLLTLNLSQCEKLSDVTMRAIARTCSNLAELRLWRCASVTLDGVIGVAQNCPALCVLDIRDTLAFNTADQGTCVVEALTQASNRSWTLHRELNNHPAPEVFVVADHNYRPSKQSVQLSEYSALV